MQDRQSGSSILTAVRGFYLDLAQWARRPAGEMLTACGQTLRWAHLARPGTSSSRLWAEDPGDREATGPDL